ncbi:MAG TPA: 50S ribosomal protein L10 [Verrucomicrobia bacterium]|nr:MAG: 50S ribosomal protein L10 [Lentisphaerae bacterium GWF2_57_35]HBA83542.1 50S ribosomal protein L10 [Verrucomicrobiota bacterium]
MRPEKKSIVDELKSQITDSLFVILTDYRGLSVLKTEELRRRLRGVNAQFHVVQNRMFKHVARELSYEGLEPALKGPSAMVVGNGDVVQAAKILRDFIKENSIPVVKIGSLEGVILSAADVEKLAGLPSREILLSQLVGTIAAPMTRLAGVLNQKVASLLYVLKAVQEKKEKV